VLTDRLRHLYGRADEADWRPAIKTAVCVVFTLVLLSLPSGQVLAQTSSNASSRVGVSSRPEEGSPGVREASARVPAAALLWQSIAENQADVVEESSFSPVPVPGWSDWPTEKRVWVVAGVVVGLMVLGIVSIG